MWHNTSTFAPNKRLKVPKQIPEAEFNAVVEAVRQLPNGGSIKRIGEVLGDVAHRRTLQRRLAVLAEQGRLERRGRGRRTLYRVPVPPSDGPAPDAPALEDSMRFRDALYFIPPLSDESVAIRRQVRAPIQQRRPVGYQRAFLDDYVPGSTWYLPEPVRSRLLAHGASPDQERVAGTYARTIYQRLLIDLSWNSSRLEGNTYSLLETDRLLQLGESVVGKDAEEAQMILNHKAAIDLLVDRTEHLGFNRYTIQNLHALLADNLLADPGARGRLRTTAVEIRGSVYHPLEVPQLVEECFDNVLEKAAAIPDPFEQAFFVLVHLPYLQPFLDVNKRVSRLAANLSLVRANLCPLSFVDVDRQAYMDGLLGVYERNRMELLRDLFCWAYERSCARYSALRQSLGQPDVFRQRHRLLIARTVRETVRGGLDKLAAAEHVRCRAEALQGLERPKFIEIVETDLLSLHEGNLATAQLSPPEFAAWRERWK